MRSSELQSMYLSPEQIIKDSEKKNECFWFACIPSDLYIHIFSKYCQLSQQSLDICDVIKCWVFLSP